jgi:hypothetical protein
MPNVKEILAVEIARVAAWFGSGCPAGVCKTPPRELDFSIDLKEL